MSAVRSSREDIRGMLADLKMPGSLEAIDAILSDIDGGRLAATDAIGRLLAAQITLRNNRRLQAAMRSSRLPAVKTLESFDFSFQPSIKREQIESLHELGFIERKENVVLLGPPGVGRLAWHAARTRERDATRADSRAPLVAARGSNSSARASAGTCYGAKRFTS